MSHLFRTSYRAAYSRFGTYRIFRASYGATYASFRYRCISGASCKATFCCYTGPASPVNAADA